MSASDLMSTEHRDLLDIIDQLRSQGINRYVDLPQIVVCGDQSAGKSSVLEAISGKSFPTKDGVCTRFATELILRRDSIRKVKVSINASPARFQEERDNLSKWQPEFDIENDELKLVIEQAEEMMGIHETEIKGFSDDVLRIELWGPEQPHLTMVDLPGLFRSGNTVQSEHHVKLVKAMVERYMNKPRSIILAVVSAKTEYVLQEVTALAKIADPSGSRTMGLITKPDTVDIDSESEQQWVNLALNKDVKLALGWHVLKNRSFAQRNFTSAQRDASEKEFFDTGIWRSIDSKHCGIDSLKSRLSLVLKKQILAELPSLVKDVEQEITECDRRLGRLGSIRTTPREQLKYLSQVSQEFTTLVTAAIKGEYTHTFFGNTKDFDEYHKRLRAVIQNRLDEFAQQIQEDGEKTVIIDDEELYSGDSRKVTRSEYLEDVKRRMLCSRGAELPGLFNPGIISDLFSEQSQPWRGIVTQLMQDVLGFVFQAARLIVEHIAAKEVVEEVSGLINNEIEQLNISMVEKVDEILKSLKELHVITYNNQLTENVQNAERNRNRRLIEKKIQQTFGMQYFDNPDKLLTVNPAHIVDLFLNEAEQDMIRFGSSKAVDYMQAYYKVALDRFIDDVSVLAIENCFISKLVFVLTPSKVLELDDAKISELVGESKGTTLERQILGEKLEILKQGLRHIKKLSKLRDVVAPTEIKNQWSQGLAFSQISEDEFSTMSMALNENGTPPSPRGSSLNPSIIEFKSASEEIGPTNPQISFSTVEDRYF